MKCWTCGCESRRSRCKECQLSATVSRLGTYYTRRDAGLCPLCGGPPKPGRKQCQDCRDRANTYHRAWRAA